MLSKGPEKLTLNPRATRLPSSWPEKNIGSTVQWRAEMKNHEQGSKWLSQEKGQASLLVQSDPTTKMNRFMRLEKH